MTESKYFKGEFMKRPVPGAGILSFGPSANTGVNDTTSLDIFKRIDCVKIKKKNHTMVQKGYDHLTPNIVATATLKTGKFVTFDEKMQQVSAVGKYLNVKKPIL